MFPIMSCPIPVVCDRCRAEGLAGEDVFEAFGALLDFEPVPRRMKRADGWDEEVQRAYIAALSLTGSDRAAARAVGKSAFGIKQLLDSPGSDGFRAAREEAMAIAGDERSRRLAEGLRAVAAEQAGWRPPDPPWSRAESRRTEASAVPLPAPANDVSDPGSERAHVELLQRLVDKYLIRLRLEREARLEGRIAEADFYLRQVTCLEVALDVVSGNGMALLKEARLGPHDLLAVAETPMSKLLDEARRGHWEECGDPPRPAPPCHLLEDRGGYRTEPLEHYWGSEDHAAKRLRYQAQYASDAEAQVAWEAEARADWAARRADGRITDADIEAARVDRKHWLDAAARVGREQQEGGERGDADARASPEQREDSPDAGRPMS
ncbi:MAG: hypothetical protein QOG84_597 [Sphingomonadales bacterium]|jgi:hypothetical protein|nr:hypothetical protein [Sphingomonadales bacterium]